ncbi:Hypothetical predicted protein [Marmota monax]|uniref:Uncharacterized protein n=1 Tax=Marmota monax TaxID=9995 RepID=A0A5E4BC88_MARMO|nr:Hypothetical predicted protein [Marmota monax]
MERAHPRPEPRAGDGSTRAAGAENRTAETRAQGHLTSWKPKRKPGAVTRGAGRRSQDAGSEQDPPRPLRAQAAGTSGQQRRSGRIVSGSSGLLRCLRLPRLRLPLPSRVPATPTSAGPRKRPGPPSSQPRNGSLSELSVSSSSSSSSTFQFHTPQPPVIASQTNMAAAAAAAAAAVA